MNKAAAVVVGIFGLGSLAMAMLGPVVGAHGEAIALSLMGFGLIGAGQWIHADPKVLEKSSSPSAPPVEA